jgi:hypothetical protein
MRGVRAVVVCFAAALARSGGNALVALASPSNLDTMPYTISAGGTVLAGERWC